MYKDYNDIAVGKDPRGSYIFKVVLKAELVRISDLIPKPTEGGGGSDLNNASFKGLITINIHPLHHFIHNCKLISLPPLSTYY